MMHIPCCMGCAVYGHRRGCTCSPAEQQRTRARGCHHPVMACTTCGAKVTLQPVAAATPAGAGEGE